MTVNQVISNESIASTSSTHQTASPVMTGIEKVKAVMKSFLNSAEKILEKLHSIICWASGHDPSAATIRENLSNYRRNQLNNENVALNLVQTHDSDGFYGPYNYLLLKESPFVEKENGLWDEKYFQDELSSIKNRAETATDPQEKTKLLEEIKGLKIKAKNSASFPQEAKGTLLSDFNCLEDKLNNKKHNIIDLFEKKIASFKKKIESLEKDFTTLSASNTIQFQSEIRDVKKKLSQSFPNTDELRKLSYFPSYSNNISNQLFGLNKRLLNMQERLSETSKMFQT